MTHCVSHHRHDGFYNDHGKWVRTKYCFLSCGDRCTCGPPMGLYYSAAHDKRVKKEEESV